MKKILILSPFNIFPPYWGGASRIYNLAKYMANENEVILLCNDIKQLKKENIDFNVDSFLSSNPNIKLHFVKSLGTFSQLFNPFLLIKGFKIIQNEKPDIIIAEFTWSGFHAILLRLMTGTRYVLDEHNVEFIRFERMGRGNKVARLILKIYEKLSCIFAFKIFCVSETDREILISEFGIKAEKIYVVPNGIDTNKFYPNEIKKKEIRAELKFNDKPVILFFGKLDYHPNYEAVQIIRNEILPRVLKMNSAAQFLIVGDNPPLDFAHENIIFTGLVENIEDYINASDVVICPLLSGGGTRIKILEAIACDKVVISTKIGAEGLIGENFLNALKITDDWDVFAENIFSSMFETCEKQNLKPITENYSWDNIAKHLLRFNYYE